MEVTFIAVNHWKSNRYIARLGVSDLKPQTRGLPLNITLCGSYEFHNEELAYTFQCPASGIIGRYVVLQSIGERDHLLVVYEMMVYGYGKISNTHSNKYKLDNYGDQIEISADRIVYVCCPHQCHCYGYLILPQTFVM